MGFLIAVAWVDTKAQPDFIDDNSRETKYVALEANKAKSGSPVSFSDINGLVINRFREKFPYASDEAWIKTNTGFLVRFNSRGIVSHAYLSNHGILQGAIWYYGEKELMLDVQKRIKQSYPCLSVTAVKEVSFGITKAYFVTMEDTRTWQVIRIVGEEMDIWESHTKGVE